MVKRLEVPTIAKGSFKRNKSCARRTFIRKQLALMMLSPNQKAEAEGCAKDNGGGGGDGAAQQQPCSSGAVTPGGFVNGEGSQEFLSTGRTGRRNAMPDILGEHAETDVADLPEKFAALSTEQPGGSGSTRSQAEPGPSQQHAG